MSRPFGAPAIRLALVALALALVGATALAAPPATQAAGIAAHAPVNLRSGPGTNYRVITLIPAGTALTRTGDPTNGFYPVVYNGASGWAYGTYLSVSDGDGGAGGGATVVTSVLNLRSGPGLGYRVITGLPYGTTVETLDGPRAADGYHWVQVRAGRAGTGWVANAYLSAGEAPAAAAAPKAVPAPAPAASGSGTITDIIVAAAHRYGQSPEAMLAVARCESNLDPRAVNPISIGAAGNNASGLFQFLPSTWRTTPYASHDIFDAWASANAAGWMWSVGRRGEWVC